MSLPTSSQSSLNSCSLYETSPAPRTSFWSSGPMTSPPLASPSRAASQAAPGPHGAGAGAPAGSQSPSPRYRPYTVSHPLPQQASRKEVICHPCPFLSMAELSTLFFLSSYDCTCDLWKFLGQRSNPSCSYNLSYSCGSAGSLTH